MNTLNHTVNTANTANHSAKTSSSQSASQKREQAQNIAAVIDTLLRKNIAFACWFNAKETDNANKDDLESDSPIDDAPEEQSLSDITLMINHTEVIKVSEMRELNKARGFVFAPFSVSEQTPIILLQPDVLLHGAEDILAFDIHSLADNSASDSLAEKSDTPATSWEQYQEYVGQSITQLQQSDTALKKVVLSRCCDIDISCDNDTHHSLGQSLGQLLMRLKRANPNDFVSMVNVPDTGLWLGATPEILLRVHNGTATTLSLAGTQALRPDRDYRWRAKEIEEQAVVSRYTVDALNRYNIRDYQTTGPENHETSAVVHLKTTFSFPALAIRHQLGEFVADLAPTPAVCGLPKHQAEQWIHAHEPHDRGYYTGFLGPWQLDNEVVELFVNIRCLQVFPQHYRLYLGGGITAKSDIRAEWEETERKATTLLRAIEQL